MSTDETRAVLERHLKAWRAGDIDAVMADWAEDGVLVNAAGIFAGKDAIRPFYSEVFGTYFPDDVRAAVDLDHIKVEGDVAFCEWQGGIAEYACDTIIVRDGKKVAHTFAAKYTT
ncbi:nuclear transport factor 2 family protein [Nocardia yamanashiensis]|uniref:nuclear transport factor 2 family protein n=1 Tax=Nocardia yamanashiensis TaxID=209247 RepID=UPI001E4041D2|nr:nuclear transport factor 2 family protein [Nocardia yamanashiensis]UGT44249.1 nuclear transport factor 2 family protein [Nocardia yamanashiensis]